MFSSGHTDWLAVTFPITTLPNATLPPVGSQSHWLNPERGKWGYRTLMRNDFGARLYLNGQENQGVHLVLGGEALTNYRGVGCDDHVLLGHFADIGGDFTRLDLAINLFEGNLTVADFEAAYRQKRIKTPAKTAKRMYEVSSQGDTFYLGSLASDRFIRVYNKAAEQGIDDMAWLRVELMLRDNRANSAAHVLASDPNTRAIINRAIGDYLDMENDEYQTALNGKAGELPQEGRKITSTERWLYEQVAPALAKFQAANPGKDVMQMIIAAYSVELNKLIGSDQGEE